MPFSWPCRLSAAMLLPSPSCQAIMSFPWVGALSRFKELKMLKLLYMEYTCCYQVQDNQSI